MPYTITAVRRDEAYRTTRIQKESAVVLAMRLTTNGYAEVLIADGNGIALDVVGFRRKHLPHAPGFENRGL